MNTEVELMPTATPAKPAFEAAFADILTAAQAQVEQSRKIVVTDPTDVDGIKQSREYRLALRKLRTTGENKRKELKEDILRAGRALDGMQAVLEQVCVVEEKRLLAQEEIAERIAAERAAKLRAEREAVLVELGENPMFHGPFERFPADEWTRKVEGLRFAKQAREEAARQAEAARIAKEKADAEERERIRAENARLKKEAEAAAAALKAEREAAEKARREAEAKAKEERDAIEAKARAEREAAEATLREERARAKAIAEAARAEAAKLAQERAKVEAEARAKEEADREAKRKAESAPDREKLLAFARDVAEMKLPPMCSNEGRSIRLEIEDELRALAQFIRTKANAL
jgi:hypothetical protein